MSKKRKILLVEDEVIMAMADKEKLETYNYSVDLVHTGEHAVQYVDENADIDLILMDIHLGDGIDGTEAAQLILENHTLPVVFRSSHTEIEIVEKTEKITSYGYVVKSSDITVLDASIKMALKLFYANQRLSESERKFRMLFENLTSGFALHEMIFDEKGNGADYRFLEINPAFEKLTGLRAKRLIGKTVKETLPGIEQYWIDTYARVVKTGIPYEYENYSKVLEKYYSVLAYSPAKNQFAVVFSDVTERKRSELNLAEHSKFIDTLMSMHPDIVYIYDIFDKKNIFINDGITRLLEYTDSEIKTFGENVLSLLMHPDDLIDYTTRVIPRYQNAEDQEVIVHRYRMKNKSGSWVWLESRELIYKRNEDGAPRQILGITHDITWSQNYENAIQQQLEEKEILIKEVHHRIKNNMTTIKSLLQLQLAQLKSPEAKEALLSAQNRISSMLILYNKLFSHDKIRSISIKHYLHDLINSIQTASMYRIQIHKEIEDLELDIKTIFPLGILVNELITNAMKYAFDQKTEDNKIAVRVTSENETITLIVQDNGKGFAEKETSSEGFGLQLVNILSKQLDGNLEITSCKGTKAVLTFAL